jgi:hypothetical protein
MSIKLPVPKDQRPIIESLKIPSGNIGRIWELVADPTEMNIEGTEPRDLVTITTGLALDDGEKPSERKHRVIEIHRALRPTEMEEEARTLLGLAGHKFRTIFCKDCGIQIDCIDIDAHITKRGIEYSTSLDTSHTSFQGAVQELLKAWFENDLARAWEHYIPPNDRCPKCGNYRWPTCDVCQFQADERRMIEEGDEWNKPRKLSKEEL